MNRFVFVFVGVVLGQGAHGAKNTLTPQKTGGEIRLQTPNIKATKNPVIVLDKTPDLSVLDKSPPKTARRESLYRSSGGIASTQRKLTDLGPSFLKK